MKVLTSVRTKKKPYPVQINLGSYPRKLELSEHDRARIVENLRAKWPEDRGEVDIDWWEFDRRWRANAQDCWMTDSDTYHAIERACRRQSYFGYQIKVEEVYGQVLLRLRKLLLEGRELTYLDYYVSLIVKRLALNDYKKSKRMFGVLLSSFHMDVLGCASVPPDAEVEDNERQQAIRQALDRLDPLSRDIVCMRFVGGCSYDEICSSTGLELDAVRKCLVRAKQKLRKVTERLLITK